jgi:hypothetical protein
MLPFTNAMLMIGSASAAPAFVPTDLGSKLLAWWDVSDNSTITLVSGGTFTPGTGVQGLSDKSGNGHNFVQPTGSFKPTYQIDGSGNPYLLFDGVNDAMTTSITLTLPYDVIFAIQQVSWTAGDCICGFSATAIGALAQQPSSPSLRLTDASSAPANLDNSGLSIGSNGVVTARHIAGASKLAINNGAYATANAGSSNPPNSNFILGGISISGASASNMRFYGGVICDGTLTSTEIANLRTYLGAKCGLTL